MINKIMNTQNIKKFFVLGNPIKHSQSPKIHILFAEQFKEFDLQIDYQTYFVEMDFFHENLQKISEIPNICGLNITVPFKEQAYLASIENLSEFAEIAQSVNTLKFDSINKIWLGYNTDGIGLVNDIKNRLQYSIKDKNILLLGAGGAAKGVIFPLLSENPKSIFIANRTKQKADLLVKNFDVYKNQNTILQSDDLLFSNILKNNIKFDIIINATAASLHNQNIIIPDNLINSNNSNNSNNVVLIYDMMYAKNSATNFLTNFATSAKNHNNLILSDGLGMLIEQAAKSFEIWNNKTPNTQIVYATMRSFLDNIYI